VGGAALGSVACRLSRADVTSARVAAGHTCVTVFHEHPSLLSEAGEKAKWRPVDAALATRLAEAVRLRTGRVSPPLLTLDSLSICADGAMIAGFRDDADGAFAELRAASSVAALATLGGELTSRPKALIHVTLGRVLGMPADLTEDQRARIAHCVRQHNQVIFPALVDGVAPATASLKVSSLSLARDRVWWMTQYELYDTWPLGTVQ